MKRIAIVFTLLLVLATSITFSIINFTPVSINYFFGKVDLPLSALIIATLVSGIFIGLMADIYFILKYRRKIKALNKQIESSSSELNILRNLPIKELS